MPVPARASSPRIGTAENLGRFNLLAQIVGGKRNHEIASSLGLTDKTVRNYVANVLTKLQARDRTHLLEMARAAGYPGTGGR